MRNEFHERLKYSVMSIGDTIFNAISDFSAPILKYGGLTCGFYGVFNKDLRIIMGGGALYLAGSIIDKSVALNRDSHKFSVLEKELKKEIRVLNPNQSDKLEKTPTDKYAPINNLGELIKQKEISGERYLLQPGILFDISGTQNFGEKMCFKKEYLSSDKWCNETGIKNKILYPNKEIKQILESISIRELESAPCVDISRHRNVPLYLIIGFKTLLLYAQNWKRVGWFDMPGAKIDLLRLEQNCIKCPEFRRGYVDCVPESGY